MKQTLVYIAGVVLFLAVVPYFIDVIKKKTKPRVVSWFTWSVLTAIATAAAFSDGAVASGVLTLAGSLATGAIVVVGLRYGDRKIERFDIFCLAGALVGLILWQVLGSPEIAIIATVSIDFIGALPTIRHGWLKPHEETVSAFVISSFASFLALLAVEKVSISNLSFPLYLTLMNAVIAGAIYFSKNKEPQPKNS